MKNKNLENMLYSCGRYRYRTVPFAGETKKELFENLEEMENLRKFQKIDFYLNLFKHPSQYEKGLLGGKIELDKDNPDGIRFLARSSVLSREEREGLKDLSIKDILEGIKNAEDKLSEPLIYQAIAVFFANFQVGKSPYRGLEGGDNSGIWIKALLGRKHYDQFLKDKQGCIGKIQEDATMKKPLQRLLVRGEMEYIINNIRGSNPHHIFFGFHKGIDDSSTKLLSNKLIEKLEDCIGSYFNKSSTK